MLRFKEDTYNGVIVDVDSLPQSIEEFISELQLCIDSVQTKSLLWFHIPIQLSQYIPILTMQGFEFHSCESSSLLLVKKIHSNAYVPTTRNYIVGVGAIVIHSDTVLVVRHKLSNWYALPGGHIEKNESIQFALQREVLEETGVDVAFESIINIGHFKHGQFGESNLYLVCTAHAQHTDISVNDSDEIAEALWMPISDFLESEQVNMYNKSVVQTALGNSVQKLTIQHIPLKVSDAEVFF